MKSSFVSSEPLTRAHFPRVKWVLGCGTRRVPNIKVLLEGVMLQYLVDFFFFYGFTYIMTYRQLLSHFLIFIVVVFFSSLFAHLNQRHPPRTYYEISSLYVTSTTSRCTIFQNCFLSLVAPFFNFVILGPTLILSTY